MADPRGALPGSGPSTHREYRITLLDHSAALEQQANDPDLRVWGDDYIAGGAGDDEIFGQLGADVIQGDGSIVGARVGASITAGGALVVLASQESLLTDGDDYVEGGGGNDVIFGNLGLDDILGGSSDLFGLAARSQRPDGSDLILGGAGTDISRNNFGDATIDANRVITVKTDGHALDADTIVGDNGRIFVDNEKDSVFMS